jgi:thiamine kinase-like enzyme
MSLNIGNRVYPHLQIANTPNGRFVQKKISAKEQKFYSLFPNASYILYPNKVKNGIATFPYLAEGNILGKDKIYFQKAISALAQFHFGSKTVKSDPVFVQENYIETIQNIFESVDTHKAAINLEYLNMLKREISEIPESELCLCHDDLIALNVLKVGVDIKILDWDQVKIGFGESDVGRFLGDLFYEELSFTHRYYDFRWHNELCELYVAKRHDLDGNYDQQQGKKRILLGELWNYLGPISSCTSKNDYESEWFRANIAAFNNVGKLVQFPS